MTLPAGTPLASIRPKATVPSKSLGIDCLDLQDGVRDFWLESCRVLFQSSLDRMFSTVLSQKEGFYLIQAIVQAVNAVAVATVNSIRVALAVQLDTAALLAVASPLGGLEGTQLRCHHGVIIELLSRMEKRPCRLTHNSSHR